MEFTEMGDQKPPAGSLVRCALFSTAAGLMIGTVIVLYRLAWGRHTWPPGHPWSGLSVTFLALGLYGFALGRERNPVSTVLGIVVLVPAILAITYWTSAAVIEMAR